VDYVIHWINHYSADSVVCFVDLIHLIAILQYVVDSIIQPLNNWGLLYKSLHLRKCFPVNMSQAQRWGNSGIKITGMLIGKFELSPKETKLGVVCVLLDS